NSWINDGFISNDQQIIGTYLHGLFDQPDITQQIMLWVNPDFESTSNFSLDEHREQQLNKLADCYRQHLDLDKIQSIAGITL
ncbi:MAG: cobyric acid synthase CobQ, partial [Gammaproteobacteria bacterium]|nr:cobyric acid synthase CobQ [Gammaproteobacteria bacterium]